MHQSFPSVRPVRAGAFVLTLTLKLTGTANDISSWLHSSHNDLPKHLKAAEFLGENFKLSEALNKQLILQVKHEDKIESNKAGKLGKAEG